MANDTNVPNVEVSLAAAVVNLSAHDEVLVKHDLKALARGRRRNFVFSDRNLNVFSEFRIRGCNM